MIQVDARGLACPLPVVKTLEAIRTLQGAGEVQTLVDNEVAVQNLTRLAKEKGCGFRAETLSAQEFRVTLTVGEAVEADQTAVCAPDARQKNTVVVISADHMGEGDDTLGQTLLKGFLFALTQLPKLPQTILFYNGGARVTCEGSASLEDLETLASQGVEILTCGTCLNYYGLTDKLRAGGVTNMYVIAEKLAAAARIIRP